MYILSETWQFTGWTAIIYLAAITSISPDLFEAAEMDGASRLQQIWYVTIPSILPTIMIMLIMNVGHMLSLGFEKVLLMYTPSNSGVSDIIDTLVYRHRPCQPELFLCDGHWPVQRHCRPDLVTSSNAVSRKLTGESIY